MSSLSARLQTGLAGRYEVIRELGRGAMATVFLARDLRHNREVAIKVLDPELAASVGRSRFLREIETVAGLTHPHIVPIHDSGDAQGLLYYVMPYIDGESLRDRLRQARQLTVDEAVRIVRGVADALDFAHARGVVHRDIKPENILLAGRHALVADFGIARAVAQVRGTTLTTAGTTLGTPHYMSPEQAMGDDEVDGRSDIYSLGCVAFEMLAGEPPFTGPTVQSIIVKHLALDAPPLRTLRPSVAPQLEGVVARALAKSPAYRHQSAGSMAREMEAVAGTGTAAADEPGERSFAKPRTARGEGRADAQPGAWSFRRFGLIGAVGTILGLVLWAVASQSGVRRALPPTMGGLPSLAVLPFVEYGMPGESTYFADGLTEELIVALGRIAGVKVISRTSAFAFRDRSHLTLRQIADSLRVTTVLEGSVRREGNRVRVIARLVDVAADSQLLARDFERELRDVFALQDEIAQDIAGALRVRIAGSADASLTTVPTSDVEAYDLYLRGRAYWNQRTPSALRAAIAHFESAVARDSGFAAAYVGLSDALALTGLFGAAPPAEMRSLAVAAAERALHMDSTNGGAHAALGHALFNFYHDYRSAERHLERALALDPSYNATRLFLGILYNDLGQFDRAIVLLQRALERDPLSAPIRSTLGRIYLSADRPGEALEELRISAALNPAWSATHVWIGHALLAQGMRDEALAAFQRGASLGSAADSVSLAYGLAVVGQRDAAEQLLSELARERPDVFNFQAFIAMAYVGLGEREEAFRWLDRHTQSPGSASTLRLPAFAPLRDDPRFEGVLRALGASP